MGWLLLIVAVCGVALTVSLLRSGRTGSTRSISRSGSWDTNVIKHPSTWVTGRDPATTNQCAYLWKRWHVDASGWTKAQASMEIDRRERGG